MTVTYQGAELDFGAPFQRVAMHDLVQQATGLDVTAWSNVRWRLTLTRESEYRECEGT